jgi:hypothetical protein
MSNFFTTNLLTTVASNVPSSERVTSISMQSYAGQDDQTVFRIGNDTTNATMLVYSTDPNITISYNEARGFAPALNYTVEGGCVGSTIFVKLSSPLDPIEGDRTGQIVVGSEILSVSYFLASTHEGNTNRSPAERFAGTETFNLLEQFEIEGEAVVIYRYDPISKPLGCPEVAVSSDVFASLNDPAEMCNPRNTIVGYRLVETYPTKAFIGDQDLDQNTLHDFLRGGIVFSDTTRILIPPEFQGFNPKPLHKRVMFAGGITFQTPTFQHTQFTLKRNDGEYSLTNIRKQSYFKGQFLFYSADLARINYPGVGSDVGFLPWNQLYDEHGKIVHYVKSWSILDRNDPYCDPQNPYCYNAAELGLQVMELENDAIVIKTWTGE